MSTIKRGYEAKNEDHQIRIHLPRKGIQGEVGEITLISTMPETFNIGVTSSYSQGNGAGEASGFTGAISATTLGTANLPSLFIGTSQLVWTGSEHLVVQLPFHIHAVNNPETEVSEIIELLMEGASPSLLRGGAMVPPSVKALELYTNNLGAINGGVPDFGVTLELGNWLRFTQLVITSVTPDVELHMWKKRGTNRSFPMEARIDVTFQTYFALTDQYIRKCFGRIGANAAPQESTEPIWQAVSGAANVFNEGIRKPIVDIMNGTLQGGANFLTGFIKTNADGSQEGH